MHSLIPLSALNAGEHAEIAQLMGPDEQVRRLEEMGLRNGTQLRMVRGGSPCIIRIGASTLCFREAELLQVMVTPRATA